MLAGEPIYDPDPELSEARFFRQAGIRKPISAKLGAKVPEKLQRRYCILVLDSLIQIGRKGLMLEKCFARGLFQSLLWTHILIHNSQITLTIKCGKEDSENKPQT